MIKLLKNSLNDLYIQILNFHDIKGNNYNCDGNMMTTKSTGRDTTVKTMTIKSTESITKKQQEDKTTTTVKTITTEQQNTMKCKTLCMNITYIK